MKFRFQFTIQNAKNMTVFFIATSIHRFAFIQMASCFSTLSFSGLKLFSPWFFTLFRHILLRHIRFRNWSCQLNSFQLFYNHFFPARASSHLSFSRYEKCKYKKELSKMPPCRRYSLNWLPDIKVTEYERYLQVCHIYVCIYIYHLNFILRIIDINI